MSPKPLKDCKGLTSLAAGFIVLAFCFLPSTAPPLFAQEVGATLFGTVTDAGGASVPDANVTVNDPKTGKTVTVTTQTDGSYVVSALTPSTYTVSVEKTGF